MVPRSQGRVPGSTARSMTASRACRRSPTLGFDVLYFPPIHPIGHTNRKGKNNSLKAEPGDPGSFYAIGNEHGGHDAIHPELGTLDDFRRLVEVCRSTTWRSRSTSPCNARPTIPGSSSIRNGSSTRPDGTIKYAENPPKKYEDIVNPDFNCPDRIALWEALRDVILFWCEQGVRIFRVDNPHTKPLPFWEWMIREVPRPRIRK